MEGWIGETAGQLRLIAVKTFRYARVCSLERLLEQARSRHYSTFSLYGKAEFEKACQTFEDSILRESDDPSKVAWYDQNILLQIGRTDAGQSV